MTSKYYTPTIEELSINNSYYHRNEGNDYYSEIQITPNHYSFLLGHWDMNNENWPEWMDVKLKYLDESDIQEFGFIEELDVEKVFNSQWGGGSRLFYKPYYSKIYNKELFHFIRCSLFTTTEGLFLTINDNFRGRVKNKSELKRLLFQLEIL